VFVEPFLSAVLDGRKTMESRFTVTRQAPWGCVEPDDIILLKQSGGPVVGLAIAGEAQSLVLSPSTVRKLRHQFAKLLCAEDDEFWASRETKNYATLIEIRDVIGIPDVRIEKRDRRGWVTYSRQMGSRPPLAA
jgi:hypothetical protein